MFWSWVLVSGFGGVGRFLFSWRLAPGRGKLGGEGEPYIPRAVSRFVRSTELIAAAVGLTCDTRATIPYGQVMSAWVSVCNAKDRTKFGRIRKRRRFVLCRHA